MNIIIPVGGKGIRFVNAGYKTPKPLIQIFDKKMIEYVLDLVFKHSENKSINLFVFYNKMLTEFDFESYINKPHTNVNIKCVQIDIETKGAVETLYIGIKRLLQEKIHLYSKTLILDCDTFYTCDIIEKVYSSEQNLIFFTNNTEKKPIYSYIKLNSDETVSDIMEKEKISDNANTGAYVFQDILLFYKECEYVLKNNITFNNEPYTSCVISEMLKKNIEFVGVELKNECVISFGTPTAIKTYENKTLCFLFDLDGTLVDTQYVYYNVWKEILSKFNITLTDEIYMNYILGNNDLYVKTSLLNTIDVTVEEISKLKDELFIRLLHHIKIIPGVINFLSELSHYGHKMCIVTNCNRVVANVILKYLCIDTFFDFVISSNDCSKGKPDPQPYLLAIKKYNTSSDKCIIFEDSKTGIMSARSTNPLLLICLETTYTKEELQKFNSFISLPHFENFTTLNIMQLIQNKKSNLLHSIISESFANKMTVTELVFDNVNMKGGFIANVICFKLKTSLEELSLILKYENENENILSEMAKQLNLYSREYYFYSNISPFVNVNVPKFYGLIDCRDCKGIILENLFEKKFILNLNLNNESIDVTLKIVDYMARLHSKFWNKNIKDCFPNLKTSIDSEFHPFIPHFINEKFEIFKKKWSIILQKSTLLLLENIIIQLPHLQTYFSTGKHLTFIHGDIKSPNIFYDVAHDYTPYFIDWQHCCIGKGVQDLIFFITESFDISNIILIYDLVTTYYFKKIYEYGVTNYSKEEFQMDLKNAICYIPFFTSVWFGTIQQDELIDKNFPYFFITKFIMLFEYIHR
jgi:HAD superfamily hydrolase (TIGR01509 family)